MPAPSGNKTIAGGPGSRLSELGIVLPAPPTPLGAYVESSEAGQFALPQRNAAGGEPKAGHVQVALVKIFQSRKGGKPRASLHSMRSQPRKNTSAIWTGLKS